MKLHRPLEVADGSRLGGPLHEPVLAAYPNGGRGIERVVAAVDDEHLTDPVKVRSDVISVESSDIE
jgi:hypothetical protein